MSCMFHLINLSTGQMSQCHLTRELAVTFVSFLWYGHKEIKCRMIIYSEKRFFFSGFSIDCLSSFHPLVFPLYTGSVFVQSSTENVLPCIRVHPLLLINSLRIWSCLRLSA